VEDLSSLDCGHVFHLGCISQHFEYRGSCPNCQKRAALKEVRTIHFRLTPNNSRLQSHLKAVLNSLPASEQKQVEALMKELKAMGESNEKMKLQIASLESDLRSKVKIVESLREEVYRYRVDGDKLMKENRRLAEAVK
jgi:septal ring factor EnvC (AmiA/AmiB activator)